MIIPENAIPAGSLPPEQNEGKAAPSPETGNEAPILGKFKSAEEVIPAYQNLEKELGRKGDELGMLRKQNEMLMNLVQNQGASPNAQAQSQEAPPDFDKGLNEAYSQIESGDLSLAEGLKRVSDLTAAKTAAQVRQEYARMDSERSAKSLQEQFQREHPDFQEALQSGELAALRAQQPMHDNFSAYWAWKATQSQAVAEQRAKEAFEKGRTEAANLAAGANATGRVLGRSGSEARQTNTTTTQGLPATEADKLTGMLGALRSARGG
jgi:hypothetical protein